MLLRTASGKVTVSPDEIRRQIQDSLVKDRSQLQPLLETILRTSEGRRGAGKAIIALVRKFLEIIYRTLKNQWVFEDFPNFVLAEKA
jgi:hypothetical protein